MTPTQQPALDWAAIRQQYPKAFELLVAPKREWAHFLNPPGSPFHDMFVAMGDIEFAPTNPRDLYDFFDERGVFVSVRPRVTIKGEMPFWASIASKVYFEMDSFSGKFDTRPAAETAGFTAAFSVLEKQLTGGEPKQR